MMKKDKNKDLKKKKIESENEKVFNDLIQVSPHLNDFPKKHIMEYINYIIKLGKLAQGDVNFKPTVKETASLHRLL